MRVLVTGHNGYIGSVLAPLFREAGHDVVGLDTDFFADCVFGEPDGRVPAVRKDIRDVSAEDLEGFDAIVHLAALSNDPLGELRAEWTYDINHRASVRLARLARKAGVRRFLFSSSCSMYGRSGDGLVDETAPLRPLTHYARSKVRVEEDLVALADETFSPVFLRNATAYGLSPRLRLDLVLNNLAAWAFTTGKVLIKSDGTPWRPVVHVEDIARAFLALAEAPREVVHARAFNVGSNAENYRVRDLAEAVARAVPGSRVEYADGAGPDPRSYRVDFTKIERAVPGFRPRWTAERGAAQLYEGFLRAGLTRERFEGRLYTRLRQLRHLIDSGRLDETLRWREAKRHD